MLPIILFLIMSTVPVNSWAMANLPSAETQSLIGQKAYDVMLEKNTGEKASIVSSQAGKNLVLAFWATWCPHCHVELGKISAMAEDLKTQGIEVHLIDLGETREEVNAYLEHNKIQLDSFIDEENSLQDAYQIQGVPTLVFINKEGVIVHIDHALPSDFNEIFNP